MKLQRVALFGASSSLGQSIKKNCTVDLKIDSFCRFPDNSSIKGPEYSDLNEAKKWISENLTKPHYNSIIFNQAYTSTAKINELTLEDYRKSFDVNVGFSLLVVQHILNISPHRPRFIFISSIAGSFRSVTASSVYSASKAAINSFVRHMSYECGDKADFISVCPSQIESKELYEKINTLEIKRLTTASPVKQLCTLDELSELILFLTHYQGRHLNGSVINVNGGQY